MKETHNTFEEYLVNYYGLKKDSNPSFSLRAFAFKLGLEPSLLSKYFRGERKVSYKMFNRITQNLGLPHDEIQTLSQKYFGKNITDSEYFSSLNANDISIMDSITYYILLEMRELKGYNPSIKWIANKLGTEINHLRTILNNLVAAGLAQVNNDQMEIIKPRSNSTLMNSSTEDKLKKIQAESIDLAKKALYEVDLEKRMQTTLTFSIDSRQISKYKKVSENFLLKCSELSEKSSKSKDVVYNLMVSLFPVTK